MIGSISIGVKAYWKYGREGNQWEWNWSTLEILLVVGFDDQWEKKPTGSRVSSVNAWEGKPTGNREGNLTGSRETSLCEVGQKGRKSMGLKATASRSRGYSINGLESLQQADKYKSTRSREWSLLEVGKQKPTGSRQINSSSTESK